MSEPGEGAPRHPIGVAAERTGLSPDVLRIWERRYGAVVPARGAGGQRLYTDADVHRLRLLRQVAEAGRAIGTVARLPLEELERLVEEDAAFRAAAPAPASEPAELVASGLEEAESRYRVLDAEGLEALLRRALVTLGLGRFLEAVAVPMLRRIGEDWHAGRLGVAHEHLATAALQRVIARGMDALARDPGAPALVLGTLPGERHEVGVLLAAAVAALEGWRVVYLGADLPLEEIAQAALRARARAVGVSLVFVPDRERVARDLLQLRARLPAGVALLVGGAGALELGPEVRAAGGEPVTLAELPAVLRARGAAPAA